MTACISTRCLSSASASRISADAQSAPRSVFVVHYIGDEVCYSTNGCTLFRKQVDIWDSAVLFVNVYILYGPAG